MKSKIQPKTGSESVTKKEFESVFREHYEGMCAFARGFIPDMETIEDIVHDIFIKLWEKRDEVDFSRSLKSYLFTSVHNRCLNYIRDNKKFSDNTNLQNQNDGYDKDASEMMQDVEMEEKIHLAIEKLPEKCKDIFIMNRFDELKYREIAEKLGVSVKTVEAQMTKALKLLREQLADYLKLIILLFYLLNL